MALNNGKRVTSEVDGVLCSIVDDKATSARVQFLKDLLTFNKFTVKVAENKTPEGTTAGTFTIGVDDVTFNPVIAIYEKSLYNRNGVIVTPAFWNQESTDTNIPYWTKGRQIAGIYREEAR